MRAGIVAVALAFILFVPVALAATPIVVHRVGDERISADAGEPGQATFQLFNLNPTNDFLVRVDVSEHPTWQVQTAMPPLADAGGFFLAPRANATVDIFFEPNGAPSSTEFLVTFEFVHGETGEVTESVHSVIVDSRVPPLVLDIFRNPLPSPLDNAYGTFLLNMVFWVGVALVSIIAGDTIVRIVTSRASNAVTREIMTKFHRPVFYLVFFLGLARSFAALPRNYFTDTIAKSLIAIAVLVYGLYLGYRVLDAALLYYQREIAPRTVTKVDDILIPLVRRVGILVLYVVAGVIVLRRLGWDPTVIFAGAGIAGLVIAFAAQDTFSNLFSGIFILLDQPFREGDDIKLETGEIARVEKIGLRTTRLYHGRNHETIVMPNNHLATRRIVNLTGPDVRYWVMIKIGAAYGTDTQKVSRVLEELALANPRVSKEQDWQPVVIFSEFGESSLDFLLRFSVSNYRDRFGVATEIRHAIAKAFEDNGIEIPFPQRTVWLKTETPEGETA